MKTDTLLNLYQSYTLTKVSELNKQSLIALYAQNGQLGQLNDELAKANRTSEQILRNQIKEIELQEKRRYYKNMTFNLSQAMNLLENEENVNFRIFASSLFLSPIRDMAKNAVQELEEIADKEYAQNIVKKANSLFDNDKAYSISYKESPWASFLSKRSQFSEFIPKIKKEIREITSKIEKAQKDYKDLVSKNNKIRKNEPFSAKEAKKGCLGCMQFIVFGLVVVLIGTIITHDYEATWGAIILLIPALLLLLSFYWEKKRKTKYDSEKTEERKNVKEKKENSEEALEKELEILSDELTNLQHEETRLTTQYNELLQDITADCPKWESKLSEIAELIPHEEKKTIGNKDPLLTEAAKLVVKEKDASTSLIQRKFAIGYTRAGRIMNQLEALSIVGPANGPKAREIYCESEEDLSELIKC